MTDRFPTLKSGASAVKLQSADRRLSLAARLGDEITRARWVALLKRVPLETAEALLSRTQALDVELLDRFAERWDWAALSINKSMPWSPELIEHFADRLDWNMLSFNAALPWPQEIIDQFEDVLHWVDEEDLSGLSGNGALPWSQGLIERFEERWNWDVLSGNWSLPWSVELIERFKERWDWRRYSQCSLREMDKWNAEWIGGSLVYESGNGSLSRNEELPWTVELIERFENRWDWQLLSRNRALPWSQELIKRFERRWDWRPLFLNPGIPWSLELAAPYRGCDIGGDSDSIWDLLGTSLPLGSEDSAERHLVESGGYGELSEVISGSEGISRSLNLVERLASYLSWDVLARNEFLPWSLELIERFSDFWHWYYLSLNASLPWSLELIERFSDHWDWEALSSNTALPWSLEFIDRFSDRWDVSALSGNTALPWSQELVERFPDRWDWNAACSNLDSLCCISSVPVSQKVTEQLVDLWDRESLFQTASLEPFFKELHARTRRGEAGPPWQLELLEHLENDPGVDPSQDTGEGSTFVLIKRLMDRGKLCGDPPETPWFGTFYAKGDWDRRSSIETIAWSPQIIERFEEHWNWSSLSGNETLPWSAELIERYEDRWDWEKLSENNALPWSIGLVERFQARWRWGPDQTRRRDRHCLSGSKAMPWSLDFIQGFADRWDWKVLSANGAVPWSPELIERFEDRWDWEVLSNSRSLPWSIELIERFKDHWRFVGQRTVRFRASQFGPGSGESQEIDDRSGLSANEALPWSLELIERFEDRWNWKALSRNISTLVPKLHHSDLIEIMGHRASISQPSPASHLFID